MRVEDDCRRRGKWWPKGWGRREKKNCELKKLEEDKGYVVKMGMGNPLL